MVLPIRRPKVVDGLYKDTGIYDPAREEKVRKFITLVADYAESGPTYDPSGKYLCGTCKMRQVPNACSHVENKIDFDKGGCRIYVIGSAENKPLPKKISQRDVLYTERPEPFGCSRCEYGSKAKVADGRRAGFCQFWGIRVDPKACCFKNSGDEDVVAPNRKL